MTRATHKPSLALPSIIYPGGQENRKGEGERRAGVAGGGGGGGVLLPQPKSRAVELQPLRLLGTARTVEGTDSIKLNTSFLRTSRELARLCVRGTEMMGGGGGGLSRGVGIFSLL